MAALIRAAAAAALVLAGTAAGAAPTLAPVFGEHMVLQRGQPLRLWGRAAPGQALQLRLGPRQARVRADAKGQWRATLAPLPAGGPHRLALQGHDGGVLWHDVLVGDLWLAGGQSNMEWPLQLSQDAQRHIAVQDPPTLRLARVPHRASLQAQADLAEPLAWQRASPASTAGFSAVAVHFARQLQARLNVPIGLLQVAWGGTHLETWMSPATARQDPALAPVLAALPTDTAAWAQAQQQRQQAQVQRWQPGLPAWPGPGPAPWAGDDVDDAAWPVLQAPRQWEEQGLPHFDGTLWLRRRVVLDEAAAQGPAVLHLAPVDDCDDTYVNGQRVGGTCAWDQPRAYPLPAGLLRAGANLVAVRVKDTGGGGGLHGDAGLLRLDTATGALPLAGAWQARIEAALPATAPGANDAPTLAHNGMLAPLAGLPLRGVLWYQGESNVARAQHYAGAFARFITGWRQQWQQPALPFLFVQLASYEPRATPRPEGSDWAELREAQQQALALPGTGMAVALDVGDAHDIHPRDKATVGDRLARLALRQVHGLPVAAHGPLPQGRPQRQAGTLRLRFAHGPLATSDGAAPRGFEVAGADRRFVPAQARLLGHEVQAWSTEVPQPVALRYGWADNALHANLVNAAGLPAPPLRTDRWPGLTAGVQPEFR